MKKWRRKPPKTASHLEGNNLLKFVIQTYAKVVFVCIRGIGISHGIVTKKG